MADRRLIRSVIAGDLRAREEFSNLYRPHLHRSCVHLLGLQDREAEDIVRRTFLIAFESLPKLDQRQELKIRLTQIAMNLCYERIIARKKAILLLEKDIEVMNEEQVRRSAVGSSVARNTEKPAMLRRLTRQLGRLCSKLLDLRDGQGKSYAEVARALRLPVGAAIARLHRCREMMKQRLEFEMEKEA